MPDTQPLTGYLRRRDRAGGFSPNFRSRQHHLRSFVPLEATSETVTVDEAMIHADCAI